MLWFEVVAVLCIAVMPDIYNALYSYSVGDTGEGYTMAATYLYILLRSIWVVVPVLYILRLSREGWSAFGLVRPRLADIPIGIGAWLACLVSYYAFYFGWGFVAAIIGSFTDPAVWQEAAGTATAYETTFNEDEYEAYYYFATPENGLDYLLLALGESANGIAEELVMRAYLITRLITLTGSAAVALALSSTLFALYHLYQGPFQALGILIFGVVMGLIYLATRRLWPVAIGHAVSNMMFMLFLI